MTLSAQHSADRSVLSEPAQLASKLKSKSIMSSNAADPVLTLLCLPLAVGLRHFHTGDASSMRPLTIEQVRNAPWLLLLLSFAEPLCVFSCLSCDKVFDGPTMDLTHISFLIV